MNIVWPLTQQHLDILSITDWYITFTAYNFTDHCISINLKEGPMNYEIYTDTRRPPIIIFIRYLSKPHHKCQNLKSAARYKRHKNLYLVDIIYRYWIRSYYSEDFGANICRKPSSSLPPMWFWWPQLTDNKQ